MQHADTDVSNLPSARGKAHGGGRPCLLTERQAPEAVRLITRCLWCRPGRCGNASEADVTNASDKPVWAPRWRNARGIVTPRYGWESLRRGFFALLSRGGKAADCVGRNCARSGGFLRLGQQPDQPRPVALYCICLGIPPPGDSSRASRGTRAGPAGVATADGPRVAFFAP